MLLGDQLLLRGSSASPITVKVCHSYSWRSLQHETRIAQETSLLLFFCPPLRSLTCPFERNDLPYGPAPGALWEGSALTRVPSETQEASTVQWMRAGEGDLCPFHLDPEAAVCDSPENSPICFLCFTLRDTLTLNDAGKSAMLVDYFSVSSLCLQQCASCCPGIISPSQEACGIWR